MSAPGLSHGLQILEHIMTRGEMGFNELKQTLGLTPSNLNRYLKTLLDEEYIDKSFNQKYVPGRKLTRYVEQQQAISTGNPEIYPILETLARTTPFTALWFVFEHGKMICREKAVNPNSISMQEVGEVRTDYLYHPWGYLFLAQFSKKMQEKLIKYGHHHSPPARIPDINTQALWFDHIRTHDYADDQGLVYQACRRIAIPYYNQEHQLVGAIALGTISENCHEEDIDKVVKMVKEMMQDNPST